MDADLADRVREVILAIPPGSTLSYGEVAARADGRFAPQVAVEQSARLRAEGVDVRDGRIRR